MTTTLGHDKRRFLMSAGRIALRPGLPAWSELERATETLRRLYADALGLDCRLMLVLDGADGEIFPIPDSEFDDLPSR